jgi:hypothetical protein
MSENMPAEAQPDHAKANGGVDATSIAATEARLRREAFEMRQNPLSSARAARDITDDFIAATRQLPPGELIKDAYFTLFEAVGALEVRSPAFLSICLSSLRACTPIYRIRFDISGDLRTRHSS